jgi:hypothetical protein
VEQAVELAGYFAAHGVWCVADGETLVPILAFVGGDGQQEFRRIETAELTDAVAEGKRWLATNPDGASCAVLVYDAFIPLVGGRTDCLVLEIHSYAPFEGTLSIAVPYRHAEHPDGFAIHRPKFVGVEAEETAESLGEVFFRGVERHTKGAAVWKDRLDESR